MSCLFVIHELTGQLASEMEARLSSFFLIFYINFLGIRDNGVLTSVAHILKLEKTMENCLKSQLNLISPQLHLPECYVLLLEFALHRISIDNH